MILASWLVSASAQFSEEFGPIPQRAVIPGSVPISRPQIRPKGQARRLPPPLQVDAILDPSPPAVFKIRRPPPSLAGANRSGRIDGGGLQIEQLARAPPSLSAQQLQPINEIGASIPPRPVIEDPEEPRTIVQQQEDFPPLDPPPSSLSKISADPISSPQPVATVRPPRPSASPLFSQPPAFRPERPAFVPPAVPELELPAQRDFASAPVRKQVSN